MFFEWSKTTVVMEIFAMLCSCSVVKTKFRSTSLFPIGKLIVNKYEGYEHMYNYMKDVEAIWNISLSVKQLL